MYITCGCAIKSHLQSYGICIGERACWARRQNQEAAASAARADAQQEAALVGAAVRRAAAEETAEAVRRQQRHEAERQYRRARRVLSDISCGWSLISLVSVQCGVRLPGTLQRPCQGQAAPYAGFIDLLPGTAGPQCILLVRVAEYHMAQLLAFEAYRKARSIKHFGLYGGMWLLPGNI